MGLVTLVVLYLNKDVVDVAFAAPEKLKTVTVIYYQVETQAHTESVELVSIQ
jgi:hypothetical protein